MTDLNAEYETFLDNETEELVSKIKRSQVLEAIDCGIGHEDAWLAIVMGLRNMHPVASGIGLSALMYSYWRKVLAEKHAYDTWEMERKADAEAEKAERNNDTYKMNNGSD